MQILRLVVVLFLYVSRVSDLQVLLHMDLQPKTIKVESKEQLEKQAAELEKQGRRVIDCNVFDDGVVGKLAFWAPPQGKHLEKEWTTMDADAIWLTWEMFGRVLQPEKVKITDGNDLFKLFGEHKDHKLVGFLNSTDRTAGFVCFCKAKEGKSLVFSVHLSDTKGIPPELLKFMQPAAEVIEP